MADMMGGAYGGGDEGGYGDYDDEEGAGGGMAGYGDYEDEVEGDDAAKGALSPPTTSTLSNINPPVTSSSTRHGRRLRGL
eukprot:5193936-Pyramimonas_sp.AAC.1